MDTIIFESSRKLLYKNEFIDPYTYFLTEELKNKGNNIAKYQSSYSFDKLSNSNRNIKHLDLVFILTELKAKFTAVTLNENDEIKIKQIESFIFDQFKFNFPLKNLVETEIKHFKSNYNFFDNLFKSKKPKDIYIVNFCDKPALIASAKKNNIPVIDIQHGLISRDDIVYNYPTVKKQSLNYFPDKFYTWSDIWREICEIPLLKENIIVYGNKYLEAQSRSFSPTQKKQNSMLIISQPGLTFQIASAVIKNQKKWANQDIHYKLHPSEYDIIHKLDEFKVLASFPNITLTDKNTNLYELLAKTEVVTGVYSTVLIEALSFNCKVNILELTGSEIMEPFIKKGLMSIEQKNGVQTDKASLVNLS